MDENEYYDRMSEFSQPLHTVLDIDDFPLVEVDPIECARRDLLAWREDPKNSPRPADLYRKWAKRLRELASPEAKELLREIQLETTVPYNELESPDWIDSYTGDIISDDNCWNCNQPVPVGMNKCPVCEHVQISELKSADLPDWTHFLVTRMPDAYKDEESAEKAIKASAQWVGVEEEIYILEDRGYEPPTFSESIFTTDELDFMRDEIEPLAEALRRRIHYSVQLSGTQEMIQERVRGSLEAKNYLQMCQNMIDRGEVEQDVFMLIRPFTHSYGFLEEDWATIKIKDNARHNLYEWAVDFEDLINYSEEASPLAHTYTSENEIRDIAEKFLEELVDQIPVDGDRTPFAPGLNPILRSRHYVEGFLRAQINESPNPSLEAWSHWRRKTSPEGSLAYEQVLKKTSNRKQAMSAFWREAIKAGDVMPKPKQIESVFKNGLKLKGGRKVSWSTAIKIAQSEGFAKPERLVEILEEHQFSPQLLKILSS